MSTSTQRVGRRARCASDGRWEDDPLWDRIRGELPLLWLWTTRQYRIRYRQSALGWLWSVVQPTAMLAIYGFVLSALLKVGSAGLPYVSFAFAGLVPWTFASTAVSQAFPSTLGAGPLLTKTYFPREVIPLAVVGAACIDLGIATAVLCAIAIVQRVGISVTATSIVLIDVVLIMWVAAVSVVGAAIVVFVRDALHALPLFLQLVFFGTPIMYPITLLPLHWRWVEKVNPLGFAAEATRDAILRHRWPEFPLLGAQAAVAACALVAAIVYTRSVEPRIADIA